MIPWNSGLRNRDVKKIEDEIPLFDCKKGNEHWFELSGVLKNRVLEKLGFKCIAELTIFFIHTISLLDNVLTSLVRI